jgi:hypothetical protein
MHEYPLLAGCQPYDITPGPDGALWFTEYISGKIGRITTNASKTVLTTNEYLLPFSGCGPYGILAGRDGAIWFTEFNGQQVGRLKLNGTNVVATNEFPLPSLSFDSMPEPAFMATGADGNIWFAEFHSGVISELMDSPLTITTSNYQFNAGTAFNNYLASFNDTDTLPSAIANYTAVINWGDGNSTAGIITTNPVSANSFRVSGSHTYGAPALYLATVTVTDTDSSHDLGGATTNGTCQLSVLATNGPSLAVTARPAGSNVVLTWPGNQMGFTLQSSTNISPGHTNWVNVPGTPGMITNNNPSVMVFAQTNNATAPIFYRLKR